MGDVGSTEGRGILGVQKMGGRAGDSRARREFRGTGLYWSLLLALVLGVAILIGIIQNLQPIELKYLVWDLHTPLIVVLLVTIFATVVLSTLVGVGWRRQRRRRLTEREELLVLHGSSATRAAADAETSAAERIARTVPPPPSAPDGG
jgi:uncharacterized integral membrane protein